MPDAAPASTSLPVTEAGSPKWGPVVAWLIWTAACVAALAVFALRVKISAQFPAPQEDQGFLAVQLVALMLGSGLAPLLLAERHRLVIAIATIVPLLLIAHVLRNLPLRGALPGVVVVIAWMIAFHWATRWPGVGRLLAIVSVLGPLLWYLSQEFAPTPFHVSHPLAAISPALGAAATSLPGGNVLTALWPAALLGVAHWAVKITQTRRSRLT